MGLLTYVLGFFVKLSVAPLLFFTLLRAQESPLPQDTVSVERATYAVVVMRSQSITNFTSTVEAPVLLDTLLDMPAEELLLIDTTGNTSVIPTERILSVMTEIAGENEFCKDHYCVRMVAKELEADKIILVDLSKLKSSRGLGGGANFSGTLILSIAFLGVGKDINTGEDIELLVTEKTYPRKLKGDWEELVIRMRSRTWRLMSAKAPEGRFPPESFTFELSALLAFIEDSPEIAILIGVGILSGLVGGYVLASRPPVIGDPPPYPETM